MEVKLYDVMDEKEINRKPSYIHMKPFFLWWKEIFTRFYEQTMKEKNVFLFQNTHSKSTKRLKILTVKLS